MSGEHATTVSAYFAGLAAAEPDWAQAQAILDQMIAESGGLDDSARDWARSVLEVDGIDGVDVAGAA